MCSIAWNKPIMLLFLCIAFASASESFMPQLFNPDSLGITLPKEPGEALDPKLLYFKQFPLDSGKICPKNGILISERTAGEYVFYKLGYQRQEVEIKTYKYLFKEYYDKALAVEILYQNRIAKLEKESKRNWFERNGTFIGYACGIITVILTQWAVLNVQR